MKNQFHANSFTATTLFFFTILLSSLAQSAELPKRKSGLWENKNTMAAVGIASSMQQCVDHDTDNIFTPPGKQMPIDCSVMDFNQQNGIVSMHSVCKFANITATTDAQYTGDFNSAYNAKVKVQYDRAVSGLTQAETLIDARWIGPCPADRKPGTAQVKLPDNGGTMTIDPNDPKVKALIENVKANLMQQQK